MKKLKINCFELARTKIQNIFDFKKFEVLAFSNFFSAYFIV